MAQDKSYHRAVIMTIEQGKLQHLILNNKVLFSHRALAAVFGGYSATYLELTWNSKELVLTSKEQSYKDNKAFV
ncbi:MAG: hypothetical protein K8S18_16635 [Desulfobacula sp.]|nr:hypothetical protein [Desulfobacula sp.]